MSQRRWNTNQRPNQQSYNHRSYGPPPGASQFPVFSSSQQPYYQNGSNMHISNGQSQQYLGQPIQFTQGYNQLPIQQYTGQNVPQLGYNGVYQQPHFQVPTPCTPYVVGHHQFIQHPPPLMQYRLPPPVLYYHGTPQPVMLQAPQPHSYPMAGTNSYQHYLKQHQEVNNEPDKPIEDGVTQSPNQNQQSTGKSEEANEPEAVNDALRELQIKISVLESVVRYQEKCSPAQHTSDVPTEKEQDIETASIPPSETSSSKKSIVPHEIKDAVTEIKKSVKLVDKLVKQEQSTSENCTHKFETSDSISSENQPEESTTSEVNEPIPVFDPDSEMETPILTNIKTSFGTSYADVAKAKQQNENVEKSGPCSPAPSDPTMPTYTPPLVLKVLPGQSSKAVVPESTSPEGALKSENLPANPTEKKPIDYSQWVDVKKQHKKWNDEVLEEIESKTIKMHILVLAKEVPNIPFNAIRLQDLDHETEPTEVVEKKKKNRPKKKKKEEDKPHPSIKNKIINTKAKAKTEKGVNDPLLNDNQQKSLREQFMNILTNSSETSSKNYCYTMRIIRQIYFSFEKERGPLPDFQMDIINHWKNFFLFGLEHRCGRAGIQRKVLERIVMYRSENTLNSQKMFIFLETLNKTRDVLDEVINADLLYLYEIKKDDTLLREQEKKYYETVLSFPQWKPTSWIREPVTTADLQKIPVKIDDERMEVFRKLICHQGLKRILSTSRPEINGPTSVSMERVLYVAHWSTREIELNWTPENTREFVRARLAALREEEQTPTTILYIQLYEFLLHVSSSVVNFDLQWLRQCYDIVDGKAIARTQDVIILHFFWQPQS